MWAGGGEALPLAYSCSPWPTKNHDAPGFPGATSPISSFFAAGGRSESTSKGAGASTLMCLAFAAEGLPARVSTWTLCTRTLYMQTGQGGRRLTARVTTACTGLWSEVRNCHAFPTPGVS